MNEKEILDEFEIKHNEHLQRLSWTYATKKEKEMCLGNMENEKEFFLDFILKSLSDQRETFLNQPANEHDQEVRNQLRKEIEKECNKLIDKCIGENDENYSYIYQKAVEDVIKII